MKKRIGIVTTWMERGAAYVSRQYASLLDGEYDVFIYSRGGEGASTSAEWSGWPVHRGTIPALRISTYIEKRDFLGWLKQNNIDVVIFNEQRWWYPVLWCHEMGIKTIAYIDYYTEETIPLFGAYDILLCNTRRHYSAFSWHPGAVYIPWGTDVSLFKPQGINEPKGGVRFFHSAGMSPVRKGTDLLLRAFDVIDKDARLIVHTQVPLERKIPDQRNRIERLISEGRLEIVCDTVPAPGLYHLGDVYVYPSRLDGIGLTIVEALACGLPVIVGDFPPMNEFTEPSSCKAVEVEKIYARADGYYWPQSEVSCDKLAEAMIWYIDHKEELPKLKSKARTWAEKERNWANNREQLLQTVSRTIMAPSINIEEAQNLIIRFESARMTPLNKLVERYPLMRFAARMRRIYGARKKK